MCILSSRKTVMSVIHVFLKKVAISFQSEISSFLEDYATFEKEIGGDPTREKAT